VPLLALDALLPLVVAGVHVPAMQVPPGHSEPSGTGGLSQVPVAGWQVPTTWQVSTAEHITAVPRQAPAWQ
jgi:hypothetical protein